MCRGVTKPAQEILQRAMQLSREERADLAYHLQASLADSADEALSREDWEREWTEEANRRLREIEEGGAEIITWDALKRQLEAIVRAPEEHA